MTSQRSKRRGLLSLIFITKCIKNFQKGKSLGLLTKPKKSLDQTLTPQKSHAEFPSLKNFQKGLNPQVTSERYQEFTTAKGNSSDDKHDG